MFPGLGQLYNQQRIKAYSFLLLSLTTIYISAFYSASFIPLIVLRAGAVLDCLYYSTFKQTNKQLETNHRTFMEIGLVALLVFALAVTPAVYTFITQATPIVNQFVGSTTNKAAEESAVQEGLLEYLHLKYNQSFVITEVSYMAKLKRFDFQVYSTDNTYPFSATYSKTLERYEDYYINARLAQEFNPSLVKVVEEQFANIRSVSSVVWLSEELKRKINPLDIPSYKEIRSSSPTEYEQKIKIMVYEDEETCTDAALEKIYTILSLLKSHEIDSFTFSVYSYEDDLLIEQNRYSSINDYLLYSFSITPSQFRDVNNSTDLFPYIKTR